jgi:DivIVA domain-containing protein
MGFGVGDNTSVNAFFVLIGAAVILGASLAFVGRWKIGMSKIDRPPAPKLPAASDWTGVDVKNVRFRMALRGYRMEDVDAALASLAEHLRLAEGHVAQGEAAEAESREEAGPS